MSEIPTGKLRVIHSVRGTRSCQAVHGPVHVIGTNVVPSEVAWGIRKVLHAKPQPCPQIPLPAAQICLQRPVDEEDEAQEVSLRCGVKEAKGRTQHALPCPSQP